MDRQFRDLFENIRDAILVADTDRRIINCNPAFTDRFGYSLEDIEGKPTEVVYADPSEFESMGEEIQEHMDDENFAFTVQYETKQGEVFPGETNVFYLRDADNEPSAFVGVIRDISDRQRREEKQSLIGEISRNVAEAATFEAGLEQSLRDITAYTQWRYAEAWVPVEEDGALEFAVGHSRDATLEPFFQASKDVIFPFGSGLPGRVYSQASMEWIPNVSDVSAERFHRHDLAKEHGVRAALGVPLRDGSDVLAVLTFFLIDEREEDEHLIRDIGEVIDTLGGLIARKKAADQVRAERNRLETFASIVSHDLRNPLTVAQGRLELAMDAVQDENLEAVDRALNRMDTLIEDLLSLARSGGDLGELEMVDLGELAQSCWDDVISNGGTLEIKSSSKVEADRSRVRQLLENLFRNATEHGGDSVEITLGDLPDGFFVADDGPGIPEGDRERVFEAGFSTVQGGTGFGLAIVKEIVDAHGWTIDITSSEGGGARFEITGSETAQ